MSHKHGVLVCPSLVAGSLDHRSEDCWPPWSYLDELQTHQSQYGASADLKMDSVRDFKENIPFPLPALGDSLATLVVAGVGVIAGAGACRMRVSGSISL